MRRTRIAALLCALAALALTASAASAGFCGNYVQVSSSGGNCPTCKLQIADNPEIRKYFVEASNGWSAELKWVDRNGDRANGSGQWKSGAFSGKRFQVSMSQQGNALSMAMAIAGAGTVNARFRCTDGSATGPTTRPKGNPEAAPWKKPGCAGWKRQCDRGDAKACARHETTCQVN